MEDVKHVMENKMYLPKIKMRGQNQTHIKTIPASLYKINTIIAQADWLIAINHNSMETQSVYFTTKKKNRKLSFLVSTKLWNTSWEHLKLTLGNKLEVNKSGLVFQSVFLLPQREEH